MVPIPPVPTPPPPRTICSATLGQRRRRRGGPHREVLAAVAVAALALVVAGCAGSGVENQGTAVPVDHALDLTRDCPRTVVIQAGWFPTADVGVPFQLFGGDYRIDAARKRVSGSLVVHGRDTGIDLEFRSGGPAVGFQNVPPSPTPTRRSPWCSPTSTR